MKIHIIAALLMFSVTNQSAALEQTVNSDNKQVEQWLEKGLAAQIIED